uniref:G-protein coupled receptors family 1 profile domain-containing protein n=1 Tax=Panagrellus redivivus TaxID=6233 RepID=A0A7E4UY99_PANRE
MAAMESSSSGFKASETTQWVSPIVGIILNCIEMYLVLFVTDKRMSAYKPILIQTCLIDIFNCITTFVTRFQLDYKEGNFYIIIGRLSFSNPKWLIDTFAQVWVFGLFYSVTTCPVQFVYRYIVLINNKPVSKVFYVGMMLIAFLFALIYTILNYCSFRFLQNIDGTEYILLIKDPNYANGIPAFIVTDVGSALLKVHLAIGLVMVTVAYGIMLYTSGRMWHKLVGLRTQMSAHLFRMQRQLNFTLLLNATIPCLSCLIPVAVSFILTFTRSNISGVGQVLSMIIIIYPVAHPLAAICVIRHYRRTCLLAFRKLLNLKGSKTDILGSEANSAKKQSTLGSYIYRTPNTTRWKNTNYLKPFCINNQVKVTQK